jgi:hypothetical protein
VLGSVPRQAAKINSNRTDTHRIIGILSLSSFTVALQTCANAGKECGLHYALPINPSIHRNSGESQDLLFLTTSA